MRLLCHCQTVTLKTVGVAISTSTIGGKMTAAIRMEGLLEVLPSLTLRDAD
jgi:hypothetical protein